MTGVLFWEGKGTVRAVFKKWKGIVFAGEPIPTGTLYTDSVHPKICFDSPTENGFLAFFLIGRSQKKYFV